MNPIILSKSTNPPNIQTMNNNTTIIRPNSNFVGNVNNTKTTFPPNPIILK